MMLRRSHPDREGEGVVQKGVQCGEGCGMQAHAGQLSWEGKSTQRLGRLQEDEGDCVAEARWHRGVKPPSKRQPESRELVSPGCESMQAGRQAGRQAAEEKRKKSHGASQGGAERRRSCRGKTQKPVPSQKVCEPKDVARTGEN